MLTTGVLARMAAAALAMAAAPAIAAPTVISFDLTAIYGPSASTNPVTGRFSVSFDDAADIGPTTTGLTVSGLNITTTLPMEFAYNAQYDFLTIGDDVFSNGGYGVSGAQNDLGFFYNIGSANPVSQVTYSDSKTYYQSISATAVPVVSSPTTAVPEAATWAMIMVGVGAIGGALRRRRDSRANFALA